MSDKGVNIEQLKTRIEQSGNSLSRNSIGNILNERNSPRVETLQLIAEALGVELWELFSSTKKISADKKIDGFIEYDSQIHRIKTKEDLDKFVESMDENEQVPEKPSSSVNSVIGIPKSLNYSVRTFAKRSESKSVSSKLTRYVYRKYHVSVCTKKEFQEIPNELKRDARIWVFRSNEEARIAKMELKKRLDFKFNE